MPFGGYKDFADCVKRNSDKSDPKAYCGRIQAAVEKIEKETSAFSIAKLDEAENKVFGWASVAIQEGSNPLVDSQGDMIAPAELEKAFHDFVLTSRAANEMHQGAPVGELIEMVVVTDEKLEAMGLTRKSAPKVGAWVGFKVQPDVFAKVKAGQLGMFSIEGTATRA